MATTAAILITKVRWWLRDSIAALHDDNMLTDAINAVVRLFAISASCNQAIDNISSRTASSLGWTDTSIFTYASNIKTVYAVEYQSSDFYWAFAK